MESTEIVTFITRHFALIRRATHPDTVANHSNYARGLIAMACCTGDLACADELALTKECERAVTETIRQLAKK